MFTRKQKVRVFLANKVTPRCPFQPPPLTLTHQISLFSHPPVLPPPPPNPSSSCPPSLIPHPPALPPSPLILLSSLPHPSSSCSPSLTPHPPALPPSPLILLSSLPHPSSSCPPSPTAHPPVLPNLNPHLLCLAANESNRELFTGSSDGTARSWDIETRQQLRVFDGHQGAIMCIQVCIFLQRGQPILEYHNHTSL